MSEPKNKNNKLGIRVRFPPSPTGLLHIGNARTALFNYLFAKKYGGQFILRIEDTDKERSRKEYEDSIIAGLSWLGLIWDEGPDKGGNYGPYRQSERTDIYKKYITELMENNNAYYCFCSAEELEAQKDYLLSQGMPQKYSGKCSYIEKEIAQEKVGAGEAHIIRLRVPSKKINFNDLIKGRLEFDTGLMGDIPIAKDITTPLYNFAVVVDDEEMKITHVIRGDDHISNTPKQIIIQEILGFEMPIYAHLPLILGPDKSKLSKRHGVTSVIDYKQMGYLPSALVNFIAMLGWGPNSDKELFSLDELKKEFDIKNIHAGGAIFNIQKLDWFNARYIKQLPIEQLMELCIPYLTEAGFISEKTDKQWLSKILTLEKERIKKISDITQLIDFFFVVPDYPADLLIWGKSDKPKILASLKASLAGLSELGADQFTASDIKNIFSQIAERLSNGEVYWPVRVALSGKAASLGPLEIAETIGKEKTIERITLAIKKLEI